MVTPEQQRRIGIWVIRALVIVSMLWEVNTGRSAILWVNLFAFILTFTPFLVRSVFSIQLPWKVEAGFVASVLGSVVLEKLLTGVVVQFFLGMFLGVIGFILMFVLYSNSSVKSNKTLIASFSFSFSVSLGAVWEVFSYFLLQQYNVYFGDLDVAYTPERLFYTIMGAAIVAGSGYVFIRMDKGNYADRLIASFVKVNPELISGIMGSPERVRTLIEGGESESTEFKATLRMNLHTKQRDRKMEHAVIKSISAFLNSDGGTLLIGVADDGSVSGLGKDGFKNDDGFYLHFTNLIKNSIGNENVPFIRSDIVTVDENSVLVVECARSAKAVFINYDGKEEFYIRSGPESVKLTGSKLLGYVRERF